MADLTRIMSSCSACGTGDALHTRREQAQLFDWSQPARTRRVENGDRMYAHDVHPFDRNNVPDPIPGCPTVEQPAIYHLTLACGHEAER